MTQSTDSGDTTETQAVDVANVFAIITDKKLTGVELEFNSNLSGTDTAVDVMNTLNASLSNAGWVTNSVMRVAQRDAQVQRDSEEDGNSLVGDDGQK